MRCSDSDSRKKFGINAHKALYIYKDTIQNRILSFYVALGKYLLS